MGGYLIFVPFLDTLLQEQPSSLGIAHNLAFLARVIQLRTPASYQLLDITKALNLLEYLLMKYKGDTLLLK